MVGKYLRAPNMKLYMQISHSHTVKITKPHSWHKTECAEKLNARANGGLLLTVSCFCTSLCYRPRFSIVTQRQHCCCLPLLHWHSPLCSSRTSPSGSLTSCAPVPSRNVWMSQGPVLVFTSLMPLVILPCPDAFTLNPIRSDMPQCRLLLPLPNLLLPPSFTSQSRQLHSSSS